MWRSLDRQHCEPVWALRGGVPFAVLAVVIITCLSGYSSVVQAEEEKLSRTGEIDHQIIVREHAGWNMDCAAIAHPALYLDDPPDHGRICARVENIKIHSIYVGTESQCIGRVVRGVQLIYRPDPGYAGKDGLRYAAQYPSVLRVVSVTVTVTARPRGAPSAAPSSMTTPMPQQRQSAGPVPACEELIANSPRGCSRDQCEIIQGRRAGKLFLVLRALPSAPFSERSDFPEQQPHPLP